MGKKSPSPPPAPDPVATAQAQGAANKEAAIAQQELAMIDQYTPTGSLVYRPKGTTFADQSQPTTSQVFDQAAYDAALRDSGRYSTSRPAGAISSDGVNWYGDDGSIVGTVGEGPGAPNRDDFYRTVTTQPGAATTASGTPQYEAIQTLSPDQQRILDLSEDASIGFGTIANEQIGRVSERLSEPFSIDSLGAAPTLNEDTRQQVAASIYDRNQPNFDRRYDQLQTRLANQGITDPNSDIYRQATDEFYRGLNDFELAAEREALGQAAQLYSLEAAQRDRAINEMIQQRQIPLNELQAMLSGTQVQQPSFVPTPQAAIAPAPVADSIYGSYNAQLNNYNQQLATQRANTQGLFGLLGAAGNAYAMNPGAFAFSDARLKTDIDRIGTLPSGLGLYSWKYVWGGSRQTGVMAHEVRALMPHAVVNIGGYDAVNYAEVW